MKGTQRYLSSMWKQQMIKSLLPGKRRNMHTRKEDYDKAKKHLLPLLSTSFSQTHTLHTYAPTHTHSLARHAKHSPCVKCVYVCMSRPLPKCSAPVRGQTLLWLWKLPACPSLPCLSCDSAYKATRHAHFLLTSPPPVTTKLNKEPTCMHERQILAGDFSLNLWKSTV